ncbi:NACHT domain-containing protein [Pseudofrankia inefficax]|uniref:NACHT domain-containing protein n=1 Tax=Pseudofrankia inefficax (strain DSM 45817 / CECT 9037 / DDB 130130 / EuI1c) TaxID=298654 RepID=E3J4Y1_PSEI1|nr:hypothetical protein [Pseudofrankia inefficax]ADP79432.1 hypothetical protein FraEuI1c_1365 [Pseudofrankia inefficax]
MGHLLLHSAEVLPLVGLSVAGLLNGVYQALLWLRRRAVTRGDRRRLGEREYALWRRLAEQSGQPVGKESLTAAIRRTRQDLAAAMVEGLSKEIRARLDRPASGAVGFACRELLESPDLLLETAFVSQDATITVPAQGPLPPTAPPDRKGFLVVGRPGTGKSVLCRGLESAWLADADPTRWLVTLDAVDFIAGAYPPPSRVGGREWLVDILQRRVLGSSLSVFERRVLDDALDSALTLVIDGLDEIVGLLGAADADRFLSSWAFSQAEVVTVRSSYYESVLRGSTSVVRRLHTVFSRAPDESWILRYIDVLSNRLLGSADAAAHAQTVKELWTREPAIRALASNPLLLTMLVWTHGYEGADGSIDRSSVYRQFVRQSLEREVRDGRNAVPSEVLISVLCELAWLRFRGSAGLAGRGTLQLAAALAGVPEAGRREVVDALETCPLLTLRARPAALDGEYDAGFYHKSFEEYFVARWVEDWIQGTTERGSDFFEQIDGPEVAFFVKESVYRLSRNPPLRRFAAQRLKGLLEKALADRGQSTDERSARISSFAAGRIAYYLGAIGDEPSRAWLERLVSEQTDFWVRRSGAIGLAFGGAPACVNAFIDEMRVGMESGNLAMARKNIAVELGFYGDQELDPLDPSADRGGESCRRLVSRTIAELGMDVEAANWRMILFDLNYLSRHREASASSFVAEIRPHRDELTRALRTLRADPRKACHPEISELEESLLAIGVG